MEIYFILLLALVVIAGLLTYVLCGNEKFQEIGRLLFACGILVFLLCFSQFLKLLPR